MTGTSTPELFRLSQKVRRPRHTPEMERRDAIHRRMMLDEIDAGSRGAARWPSFCLRLLAILKQECLRLNFRVAAAQVDRIEATEERDAELARDLLRDLRTRMSDEESASAPVRPPDEYTPVLM